MMTRADTAVYAAILAMTGLVALAPTTILAINFLQTRGTSDHVTETPLLTLGKRLAVGEVRLYSAGRVAPVAQVTVAYPHPPRASSIAW